MDNLSKAIDYANKGWKLFPAFWREGRHVGAVGWKEESTDNVTKIKNWGDQFKGCYFCVDLRKSGMTVIDIDIKNGKNGVESLEKLEEIKGHITDTFRVTTPSKGRHYYYRGECRQTSSELGPGIDTVYMVPLPGQMVPGKGKYKLADPSDIIDLPSWVPELVGKPAERTQKEPVKEVALDTIGNIQRAIEYLEREAPIAIEGDNGDQTTYNTACKVRGKGISLEKCVELMSKHYDPRCIPPWGDGIEEKVRNAYAYGLHDVGHESPSYDFEPILTENAPKNSENEPKEAKTAEGIELIGLAELLGPQKPVEWLVQDYIELESNCVIYGDSESFKSFIAVSLMCAVSSGTDWYGSRVKKGAVLYIAGEGNRGYGRRISAWVKQHQVDLLAMEAEIFLTKEPIAVLDDAHFQKVVTTVLKVKPTLIILDTLARNYGPGDENSTKDMSEFVRRISLLSRNSTIIIVHHTGLKDKERGRGNASLRGALDSEFLVERRGDEGAEVAAFTCKKMKDAERSAPIVFNPVSKVVGRDEDGKDITSLALEYAGSEVVIDISEEDNRIINAYTAAKDFGKKKSIRELADELGLTKSNVARKLKMFKDQGIIE